MLQKEMRGLGLRGPWQPLRVTDSPPLLRAGPTREKKTSLKRRKIGKNRTKLPQITSCRGLGEMGPPTMHTRGGKRGESRAQPEPWGAQGPSRAGGDRARRDHDPR